MKTRTLPLLRLTTLTVALGILSGCPGKNEGDSTGSDASTGTSAPSTGVEDSTSTGPDPTTGPSTNSTTDTGTSTGEPDPACECIDPSAFGNLSFTCGAGACGLLNLSCFSSDGDTDTDTGDWSDCEPEFDDAQIDCALDLLIAGEPGSVVTWRYSADPSATESGGFVQVFADRQGLTRTFSRHDLSGDDSAAGVVPLRAADYFQGCKDLPTVGARFACLKDWSEQEPAPQCDEPGHESGI